MLLPNKLAGVDQYMVVVTDGWSENMTATIHEAAVARADGIVVMAVGVTVDSVNYPIRVTELQGIASNPISQTVIMSTSGSLIVDDNSQQQIVQIACSNSANGCDSYPCNNGTCTNQPAGDFLCSCPDGYTGVRCERHCSGVIDLVFIIDDTGAFNYYNFQNVLKFVGSVVGQLEISPTKTQVAAISDSNRITEYFGLTDYRTRRDVSVAVQDIEYGGGYTNVSGMLGVLRNVFAPQNGGRPNAKRVSLLSLHCIIHL